MPPGGDDGHLPRLCASRDASPLQQFEDLTRAGDVDAVTARLLAPPAVGGITVPVVIGDKYGSRTVTDILSISPPKGQSSGRRRLKWICICGATGTCLTSSFRQLDPCRECGAKRILDKLGPQVIGTTLPHKQGRPFGVAIGDRRGTRIVTHFVLGGVQTKVGWKCNCGRVGISDGGDFKKSSICKSCLGSYSNTRASAGEGNGSVP